MFLSQRRGQKSPDGNSPSRGVTWGGWRLVKYIDTMNILVNEIDGSLPGSLPVIVTDDDIGQPDTIPGPSTLGLGLGPRKKRQIIPTIKQQTLFVPQSQRSPSVTTASIDTLSVRKTSKDSATSTSSGFGFVAPNVRSTHVV